MKKLLILILALLLKPALAHSQQVTLDLQQAITLANDSSLESFRSKNMYQTSYWEYRSYKANRLPSLTLQLTPAQYYRNITRRYDSESDLDIYRKQQSFYASGNLSLQQNVDFLGGTFSVNSELGYMRNFSSGTYSQYSSIPVRFGYSQDLIGFNAFKWERKIEPLKYEKAKREYLSNSEQISEQTTTYFFNLALAQAEYDMALDNVSSTDTLYQIGLQRFAIASISNADLMTLRLDMINARNTLQNAENAKNRAMSQLAVFLGMDRDTRIRAVIPGKPEAFFISGDEALEKARLNNPVYLENSQKTLEAEREVSRTRQQSRFNASVSASVGVNQVAETLRDAYQDPLSQELVTLSVSIPLIDWGVRKGKYNMAKNNLSVIKISSRQEEASLEDEILKTVSEFNIQQDMIQSAEEVLDLSIMAYNETKQRYIIGKADMSSLTLSLNREQEAQRNYITALQNYWSSFYRIRRLTLHDFQSGFSLSDKFDFDQ